MHMQVDGSVVVWDLRESSSLHRLFKDRNDTEFCLRQPTYNTGNTLFFIIFIIHNTYLCIDGNQRTILVIHYFSLYSLYTILTCVLMATNVQYW